MNPQVAVARFQAAMAERFGLAFDPTQRAWLEGVLLARSQSRRLGPEDYLAALEAGALPGDEAARLASALTTNETYFFRHPEQLEAFAARALPARVAARAGARTLSVLSAGCASGEEPYTLAILLRERFPELAGWDVELVGIDLDPQVLEQARAGRYGPWSFRNTPEAVRARWFTGRGRERVVHEALRRAVRFERLNLAAPERPELFAPGRWDVVFLRNVLMYLTPAVAAQVVARVAGSLAPGGFLFLGHAESLRGLEPGLVLRQAEGAFFYQRAPADPALAPVGTEAREAAWAPPPAEGDGSWFGAIQSSFDRLQALGAAAPDAEGAAQAEEAGALAARALARFVEERFDAAAEALDAAGAVVEGSSELLLLRAVVATAQGAFERAEAALGALLARAPDLPEAHHALGLCREREGDPERAEGHYREAARLDPGFALPRLRLGALLRRRGDTERAREALERALSLLPAEGARRVQLFGGGFGREALAVWGRAELDRCAPGAGTTTGRIR